MGIQTVAVYSEADERAPHVSMADEAVAIGAAASAESYLVIDKIIDAARRTGADAIHPGYGFLSENALFAEALAGAGISILVITLFGFVLFGDVANTSATYVPPHMENGKLVPAETR